MCAPVYSAHFCGIPAFPPTRQTERDAFDAQVQAELKDKIYKDTDDFFSTLFQHFVEDNEIPLDDVLKDLADAGLWNADTQEWAEFPASTNTEAVMSETFVKIANFIAHESKSLVGKRNKLDISWHYYPHRTLHTIDDEVVDHMHNVAATCNISPGSPVNPHRHPKYPSEDSMHSWDALIVPGELRGVSKFRLATQGIFNCFHQIYRETMNRRAIFGFYLCGGILRVWLSDRTGVIGSKLVDIHEYPMALVLFIAAISVMPPHLLGIDTHVQRYPPGDMDPQTPTSDINTSDPEGAGFVPERGLWEVHIDGEAFILWKPISVRRAEEMVGRGTRVWNAWLKDDFLAKPIAERTRFIVKDTWKDDRRKDEDFFYKKLQVSYGELTVGDGVARYYTSCVAQEGGENDTTTTSIRRNLKARGKPYPLAPQLAPQPANSRESEYRWFYPFSPSGEDPDMTTVCSVASDAHSAPSVRSSGTNIADPEVRGRTHQWLVLVDSYGWQLQRAISPKELALALRDAIAGHKRCWESGILHRDISTGNVLINYKKTEKNRGFLIDFDNAKEMPDEKCSCDYPLSASHTCVPPSPLCSNDLYFTLPFTSYEVLHRQYYFTVPGKTDQSHNPALANHAVHDLESFLWCLVYCCAMCDGPNTRRYALRALGPVPNTQLDVAMGRLTSLFEDHRSTMAVRKHILIRDEELFQMDVLDHFAAFWVSLVPLCRDFHGLIRGAYKTREFTGLHSNILQVFDRHLPGLSDVAENPWHCVLQAREEERRKRDLTEVWRLPPREQASNIAKKRPSQQKDAGEGGDKEERADAKRVRRGFPEEW